MDPTPESPAHCRHLRVPQLLPAWPRRKRGPVHALPTSSLDWYLLLLGRQWLSWLSRVPLGLMNLGSPLPQAWEGKRGLCLGCPAGEAAAGWQSALQGEGGGWGGGAGRSWQGRVCLCVSARRRLARAQLCSRGMRRLRVARGMAGAPGLSPPPCPWKEEEGSSWGELSELSSFSRAGLGDGCRPSGGTFGAERLACRRGGNWGGPLRPEEAATGPAHTAGGRTLEGQL